MLAAACALCGHGKSWHRTWVPRLWDQGSHSDDLLRSAETASLPGRRRDHLAFLTIDGLLQGNRYKAGLSSNHPHIAHRSSRCRPMPVMLVDHRFHYVPFRVAQSTTCAGRRVHRPYPLRRPVHLVLIPAMESVLPAEPEPVQRMFENARIRVPFKLLWRSNSSVNRRSCSVWVVFLQLLRLTARREGAQTNSGGDKSSAPCVTPLRGERAEVLYDSSVFRRLVAQPVLRVPKQDA